MSDCSTEIKVTEEMIEAGSAQLARYRYDQSNEREVVVAIFMRMLEARRLADPEDWRLWVGILGPDRTPLYWDESTQSWSNPRPNQAMKDLMTDYQRSVSDPIK